MSDIVGYRRLTLPACYLSGDHVCELIKNKNGVDGSEISYPARASGVEERHVSLKPLRSIGIRNALTSGFFSLKL